jgi:hypothetical protein
MSDEMVTHCKGCVFAKCSLDGENKQQEGCAFDRHESLGVKAAHDGFFVLERFCNTFRPDQWVNDLDFEDQLNIQEAAIEEVYPRVGFFVRLDTSSENAMQDLKKTLESIAIASYKRNGKPPFIVVINDKVEYNEEIWSLFVRLFGELGDTDYHIVQISKMPEKQIYLVDEAFNHAQNGWIYVTTSGEIVAESIIDKLHNAINVEMKQVMTVEPYDGFNGLIFPAFLFKFLNGNRMKVYQDEQVDSGTFIEKVKTAQDRSDIKTVYTWEEFDAS